MSLIKQELIDCLCIKRAALIDNVDKQIALVKSSYQICSEMNDMIPAHAEAYYDHLNLIFIDFKMKMGEKAKQPLPQDVNLLSLCQQKCVEIFTHVLDSHLWKVLFNRLNVFSLMSSKARAEFHEALKVNPLSFTVEHIHSTLSDLVYRQDEMLINSLVDSVQSTYPSYVCNDNFKFNTKTIFCDATKINFSYGKLCNDSSFKDTLNFLSKIVFGNKTITSDNGKVKSSSLIALVEHYFLEEKIEKFDRDTVEFNGGKIVFFNNNNAHLILNSDVVSFLNGELSKTKGLQCAS
jgi:hypothetical protein